MISAQAAEQQTAAAIQGDCLRDVELARCNDQCKLQVSLDVPDHVRLRYRNSEAYRETVCRLTRRVVVGDAVAQVRRAWHRVRWRAVLGSFHAFPHRDGPATQPRWH